MQRILITVPDNLAARMKAVLPAGKRSKVIARILEEEIDRRERELYECAIPVTCLGKSVVAVSDQIWAVDKTRMIEMAGMLTEADITALDEGLRRVLVL
ncbi:MAG: hypothetical protein IBX47_13345 [Desulfuromonadales bacterium]|nr:hypothetical protein [Desulfuromonadales bacterium]